MFSITFENERNRQHSCEYLFNSRKEAKDYLESQGFIEVGRLFERRNYGWNRYTKAYIERKKLYKQPSIMIQINEEMINKFIEDSRINDVDIDKN